METKNTQALKKALYVCLTLYSMALLSEAQAEGEGDDGFQTSPKETARIQRNDRIKLEKYLSQDPERRQRTLESLKVPRSFSIVNDDSPSENLNDLGHNDVGFGSSWS